MLAAFAFQSTLSGVLQQAVEATLIQEKNCVNSFVLYCCLFSAKQRKPV